MSELGLKSVIVKKFKHHTTKVKIEDKDNRSDFSNYTSKFKIIQSFSKKGCPYDNACIESFHTILKKEEVYRVKYFDFESVKLRLFKYIEGWYNRKRIRGSKED